MYYNKHLKFAIPFFVFVIGGSLGLREFTSLRYQYRTVEEYNPRAEANKSGIRLRNLDETTLESVYEQSKKMDIDNWTNIRIQRPED